MKLVPRCSEYTNFCVSTSRLDELLFDTVANNSSAHKLWLCVRMFLLLSHGQASIEHGFSVNKHIELDNLAEDTFVAKRSSICDHVTFVGGLQNIDASNKHPLLAASSARQKYLSYLEGEKKKKECSGRGQKCKLLNDEIDELKRRKDACRLILIHWQPQLTNMPKRLKRPTRCHGLQSLTASEGQRRRRAQKWRLLMSSWIRSCMISRTANELVLDCCEIFVNMCKLVLSFWQWYYEQLELSLLILICIHKFIFVYLEIYVVPIGHGFSFFVMEKSWKINVEKRGTLPNPKRK